MTDAERWALNAEIAEGIGIGKLWPGVRIHDDWWPIETWLPAGCDPEHPGPYAVAGAKPPNFAGDLNAAWEMEEQLDDEGLWLKYEAVLLRLFSHLDPAPPGRTKRLWHLSALVRAQAAAEVLRERGAK